ncbi:MAG: hypothetical protein CM15mP70_11820 [Pelagibacteraceae bacterium]|nr:MAG: hypothetical protein CM15mP70_11820 [Pelagibacteraceae bacterium]
MDFIFHETQFTLIFPIRKEKNLSPIIKKKFIFMKHITDLNFLFFFFFIKFLFNEFQDSINGNT